MVPEWRSKPWWARIHSANWLRRVAQSEFFDGSVLAPYEENKEHCFFAEPFNCRILVMRMRRAGAARGMGGGKGGESGGMGGGMGGGVGGGRRTGVEVSGQGAASGTAKRHRRSAYGSEKRSARARRKNAPGSLTHTPTHRTSSRAPHRGAIPCGVDGPGR